MIEHRWRRALPVLGLGAALAGGCTEIDDADACGGQPCSVPQSRDALIDALDGHADPVADALRSAAAADGTVGYQWEEVLGGVADALGCDPERSRSFVVLSNLGLAPKGLMTHCTDDPVDASRFFAVFEPDEMRGDLDGERFRMVGWDATARRYRRYQIVPRDGALAVAIEPEFCSACHGGRSGGEPWVPIMNELTNPWAQWNAEPSFRSLGFEEHLEGLPTGHVFDAVAAPGRLESASRLEPAIRAALDRVTAARIGRRHEPAELEAALELLRPVFCDETVNYVSEIHRSGEIKAAAVIDPGLRRMLVALEAGSWSWLHEDAIHLPPAGVDEPELVLVPVRGEATVQAEAALLSRQVLTPMQVLRVRALDWSRPMGSTFRCGLYEAGRARVLEDGISGDHSSNATLVPVVFSEIMRLEGPRGMIDLIGDETSLIAIADAESPEVFEVLDKGEAVTPAELGEAIDAHLADLLGPGARAKLDLERHARACSVRAEDPTAPWFDDAQSCP
jgi:hypothetical protein